ncbi:hypothetical protein TCELL_0290 [Thermogladius calderae 1633]|uniref:Uncharacterized protein n=1 Tax=Thermogladius calderae (strain DSM 22663 / VKM B-2946 / 1633) TaxID=1184251 RepID=I3TD77_THEC1|nr:hypothetical protein [Thermogladius calderae]AFK50715.1 hypothetical protein TCELL_0290 [Thermogladius calderae 1633]
MGRTTPSLKELVNKYLERWSSLLPLLDPCTRAAVKEVLERADYSASLLSYKGVVDPLEPLVFHLLLVIAELKAEYEGKQCK